MGYVGCLIRKDSTMVELEKKDSTVIEPKKKNLIVVEMIERLLFAQLRQSSTTVFNPTSNKKIYLLNFYSFSIIRGLGRQRAYFRLNYKARKYAQ
jgi:hypothetical protein